MDILQKIGKIFRKKPVPSRTELMAAFEKRYASFRELLQANADLATVFSQLNGAISGERAMETSEVRKAARRACLLAERMSECLNAISGQRYVALTETARFLGKHIEKELRSHTRGDVNSVTLPLSEVDASMDYIVGGKTANLGELHNMLGLPTPRGFALTIKAGTILLLRNGDLFQKIYELLSKVDIDHPDTVHCAAEQIARLVGEARVPRELAEPLIKAWDEAFAPNPKNVVAALRSSAVAEDGVQSFAGQYESVLGVTRPTLIAALKRVVGSLYSERALSYRAAHGYALDATGMGLLCLEMVRAKAAGVAFSRHPVDLRTSSVLVEGVWGLGEMVVDGLALPDQWQVSRSGRKIVRSEIARKEMRIVIRRHGNKAQSVLEEVPGDLRNVPSLTDEQVLGIAGMALQLERHYQYPQDLEWAVDEDDNVILLQTRPMGLDCAGFEHGREQAIPALGHLKPLLFGGDIAARGVGCGPVFIEEDNEDTTHFPDGSVLVIRHPSPKAMKYLGRAIAVIAESGSLTGHMASVCRELGLPTLMNLPGATEILQNGTVVTVDALLCRVFSGQIDELLALQLGPRKKPPANTPALALLRRVAPLVLPLHLIDPDAETFSPSNCASLHDVMRYAHEKSYSEMFLISDNLTEKAQEGVASKLVCRVPLDLYIIDLGGGLKDPEKKTVTPEEVTSAPFCALLEGMLNPKVRSTGPRPVNMRGFMSVMSQSLVGGNQRAGERFGDRSYAILSDRYLNFSSRVGYHYAILDTWCGETLSKNYIRFEFAGGAAADVQRSRRARCIGAILDELGFRMEVSHDRVQARFQKYVREELLKRLDQLGRLLIMTRQMDMLMVDDEAVNIFAHKFLNEEYH